MLDACSDTEWRLIVALCRFAGLRCTSEVLSLQWQDVNWEQNRMLVRSPKTEHNPGGESRLVLIFADLRPCLMQAFEEAEPGATYCVSRHRLASCDLPQVIARSRNLPPRKATKTRSRWRCFSRC